jgi:thiosulfate dehydrogenase (quinone)
VIPQETTMSATTFTRVAEQVPPMTNAQRTWRIAAIALLSTRIIQGFIYWGGGSRRFIYAPSKLDPSGAHSWMANKFQTAMPGALLGMDHVVSFMLQHFYLLYAGVILFSAAELIVGLTLMAGLVTRIGALASVTLTALAAMSAKSHVRNIRQFRTSTGSACSTLFGSRYRILTSFRTP